MEELRTSTGASSEAGTPAGERSALDALFHPGTLAVLGASRRLGKLGHDVLVGCAARGFRGRLVGVNPAADGQAVAGWPVVSSLESVEGPIDLALVAVPASATLEVVRQCAARKVKAAVLAASGLGELGGEGAALEQEIGRVARQAGMRLVGPNGFGLFVAPEGVVLTGWQDIPSGRVALVTQSGNVAIALSVLCRRAGIGFSSCTGLGNQLDVDAADLVAYHAASPDSDAVALYLEGLRPGSGPRMREALLACRAAGKPVVVLKGGRSSGGAAAAATHTGALGGDGRLWDAVLAASGARSVASTEEMVDVLTAVVQVRRTGGRALVLTDGGGDSVLAVDALVSAGLQVARLSPSTEQALDALAPPDAPRVAGRNPVTLDTAGGLEEDPRLLSRCAAAGASDEGVDVIVVSGTFGGYRARRAEELEAVDGLVALRRSGTALLVHSAFDGTDEEPVSRLRAGGVPVYPTVQRLARALAAVAEPVVEPSAPRRSEAGAPGLLPTAETARLLASVGAVVPPIVVASAEDELASAASAVGAPLCLKVERPLLSHKSDVGGVRLGISADEVVPAARELWGRFPDASLVVMPMLAPGVELLVGAARDETFGHFVTVGRGGVTAELDPDVAFLPTPLTKEEARRAWLSLRCAPLLSGWRGRPGVDLDALCELAVAVGALAVKQDLSVECNPVMAYESGYAIADLRAVRAG
ncbi:MAG TPA: acetate--CoA ligase family protein [Acidimicrobiales bacterium]|nr:acetate--CoA ligase family protein [Acidimicrobiales bacterium]